MSVHSTKSSGEKEKVDGGINPCLPSNFLTVAQVDYTGIDNIDASAPLLPPHVTSSQPQSYGIPVNASTNRSGSNRNAARNGLHPTEKAIIVGGGRMARMGVNSNNSNTLPIDGPLTEAQRVAALKEREEARKLRAGKADAARNTLGEAMDVNWADRVAQHRDKEGLVLHGNTGQNHSNTTATDVGGSVGIPMQELYRVSGPTAAAAAAVLVPVPVAVTGLAVPTATATAAPVAAAVAGPPPSYPASTTGSSNSSVIGAGYKCTDYKSEYGEEGYQISSYKSIYDS